MKVERSRARLPQMAGILAVGAVTLAGPSCGSDTKKVSQEPPMGATAVESWLKTADYTHWHCEPSVHEARSPSPHGFNRICSNNLVAANVSGTAAWPKGASAVKELYADMNGGAPVGYAVYMKTADDSAAGSNWYWYERVPLDSAAPHDEAGIVADGLGGSGTPLSICVSCHGAVGSDTAHTPTPGGRDLVYTPVN